MHVLQAYHLALTHSLTHSDSPTNNMGNALPTKTIVYPAYINPLILTLHAF